MGDTLYQMAQNMRYFKPDDVASSTITDKKTSMLEMW